MRKFSAFNLIYATEQVGYSIAWSETRKTDDFYGIMPVYQSSQLYFPQINNLSRDMRFPTMSYVRPAKPQVNLRIRTV